MAFSFRISEEYCEASVALENAGYAWIPRPGDWMLDRDDASVGMLTLPVQDSEQIRRLNTHIPTYVQVSAMLDARGIKVVHGSEIEFRSEGKITARFTVGEFAADEGLCRLRALIAAISAGAK